MCRRKKGGKPTTSFNSENSLNLRNFEIKKCTKEYMGNQYQTTEKTLKIDT